MSNIVKLYCAHCGTEMEIEVSDTAMGKPEDAHAGHAVLMVYPCDKCVVKAAKRALGEVIDSEAVYKIIKAKVKEG